MPKAWRPFWNRWVDQRRIVVWIWPLSGMTIVGVTIIFAISMLSLFMDPAKVGGASTKKIAAVAVLSLMALAASLYVCVGLYQAFFIELRQKFIASKVVWDGDRYQLWGYYFKQDTFKASEVTSVDEYRIKLGFGPNIATLLTWMTHNYKVTLKDGREFYLPGEMERIDELRAQLEADSQTGFTP